MDEFTQPKMSKLAILGMVLAVLSLPLLILSYINFLFPLIGLAVSFYASRKIKNDVTSSLRGEGLAQTAVVFNALALLLAILMTFLVLPALQRQVASVFSAISTDLQSAASPSP